MGSGGAVRRHLLRHRFVTDPTAPKWLFGAVSFSSDRNKE